MNTTTNTITADTFFYVAGRKISLREIHAMHPEQLLAFLKDTQASARKEALTKAVVLFKNSDTMRAFRKDFDVKAMDFGIEELILG